MSTFGRKAINYWNYSNRSKENCQRWNHTPTEIKSQILKKWYPIGMEVYRTFPNGNKLNTVYVITGYDYYSGFEVVWRVGRADHLGVKIKQKNLVIPTTIFSTLNPLMVIPTEDELRNMKLNRLLNEN